MSISPRSLSAAGVILWILTICDPQNRVAHPTYKQPSREPVKPLIEFGMSSDGPQMYHNEKR